MRGFCCIGLDNPKHNVNVGSVLRAAYCFNVDMVATTGKRYKRCAADTCKGYKSIPLLNTDDLHKLLPFDCVPVAVELSDKARDIRNYCHPERAFYIFGAEDATLGYRVTSWCRDIIYVPTNTCLNLAACVNVVLYDRMLKQC